MQTNINLIQKTNLNCAVMGLCTIHRKLATTVPIMLRAIKQNFKIFKLKNNQSTAKKSKILYIYSWTSL